MITNEQVLILTAPFDDAHLGVKIQSYSRDKSKASLVLYLQHTDVAARLDKATNNWEFKVLNEWEHKTDNSEIYYVKASLSLDGITRENIGEGNEPKGAYSDALKRCAMLFGVGRNLYDSEVVWFPYEESKHKYKSWTMDDYRKLIRKDSPGKPEILPKCAFCGVEMLVSSKGDKYFCPQWNDNKGKHPTLDRKV